MEIVVSDEVLRQRIVDAAAELFAEHGYGGTKLRMVAERAKTTSRTVKRLTGGRPQLFAEVIAAKAVSEPAERLANAATDPQAEPPLAVLLEAAAEIFAAPQRNWNVLELEALLRAVTDSDVRTMESDRVQKRWANMKAVVEQSRDAGAIDPDVNEDAFVHFALALSVGLAMVDTVTAGKPRQAQWNALMARIGRALAPPEMLLAADHGARSPWRLRIDVPDRPGGLARLVGALSGLHVFVVGTAVLGTQDGFRTVDLAVTMPEGVSGDALLSAASGAGIRGYVTHGSADDALDLPTRVLDMSTELVTNPGSAPLAAAVLVEADNFEVTRAVEGEDDSADVLRLQWTLDRHVVLHRHWTPFARAEKTRASALLRLAAAISSVEGDADALGWVEPIKPSGTVWVRLARPEDGDAVAAMHERCSEQSRYQRYFTSVREWREVALRWLSGGHRGATLVVMSEEGEIVGLGHVFPNTPDDPGAAEVAMIIEDAYQGRGIGTRLLRHLLELAERLGFVEVVASVLADNAGMLHVLDAPGLNWERTLDQGVQNMRARLPSLDDVVVDTGPIETGIEARRGT